MKASTRARRDAILCAVRDGALVTTAEVCMAICATCAHFFPDGRPNHYHCYMEVYRDLRALDRLGLVHWLPSNGTTPATWMLTTRARSEFVTVDLEAMWVADA